VADGRVVEVVQRPVHGAQDLGDDVTLLPGLIDAHVHLAFDAVSDVLASMEVDDDALLERIRAAARRMARAGITTARDLGDRSFLTVALERELLPDVPTVLSAGPPLTSPGGHCWFLGGEAATPDELRRAVAERAQRGCQVVKVMVSGGNITPGSSPTESQFGAAELRAVVEEARRLGLSTAAHVHARDSVALAVEAGFDTLEHVTFRTEEGVDAPEELMRRIADSGTAVSATVGLAPGSVPIQAVAPYLPRVVENHRRMHELGARVIPGTDAGVLPNKPHDVLPHGVVMLLDLGMTPVEALRSATSEAAAAIRLRGRKGLLCTGADADLLAVHGDATKDVTALQAPLGVWVRGQALTL
jgi:imidazolonepropionase-like amidohydrolase